MNLVVDANVALKWFVRENLRDEARELYRTVAALIAPDLIIAEVTNIAWKKARRGEIAPAHARVVATGIRRSNIELIPSQEINERGLEIGLALKHPVYDCLYIACAERFGVTLITVDGKLCKAVENTEFADKVKHLSRWRMAP
jgi:predicted nucleic acid-binding protein